MVSVSIRKERYSHRLIEASGEFVINLVDEKMCRAVDFCGVRSGRDTDKAEATGLSYMPADGLKKAPAVSGAPLSLCCRVRQTLELGSHDMFIGEVVALKDDLAAGRLFQHIEAAQERALAGAGGADHADHVALADLGGNPVEDVFTAEVFFKIYDV